MRPIRNFDGIQFEQLRIKIDDRFNDLHDSLEEAYYGDRDAVTNLFTPGTGWRNGQSKPWHGFDVKPGLKNSQTQFDQLHGLIWTFYKLAFHEENQKETTPIPRSEYDHEFADDGVTIINSKVENARNSLRVSRTTRSAMFNALKTWATTQNLTINPDAMD